MKKAFAPLLLSAAILTPSLAQANEFGILLRHGLVGYEQWEKVINDKDASDGCGEFGLKEFDPTTTERIQKQGCSIIWIGDLAAIKADKNPKDGCGKIDLNFIMPKARDFILENGCASMLDPDPW